MTTFYNMLDISASNAFLMWMAINPECEATAQAPAFPAPNSKQPVGQTKPPDEKDQPALPSADEPPKKRARCFYCHRKKDKKCSIA